MDELISSLDRLSTEGDSVEQQLDAINKALATEGLCKDEATEKVRDGGVLPKLQQLLRGAATSKKAPIAKTIAEIAKLKGCRELCTDLIELLLNMIEADDLASIIQGCRALGNICFDNDVGREKIASHNGIVRLLTMMKQLLLREKCEDVVMAQTVACGCLLNVCNTHVNIQKQAVEAGALDVLHDYLRQCKEDDSATCQYALLTVGCLSESEVGIERLEKMDLIVTIATLLKQETDYQDDIFNLLSTLAEQDSIKLKLASSRDVIDALLHLVSHSPPDDDEISKLAADLIVLMLTGDESMPLLYGDGDGVVYREALKWITSPRPHLRMSGALAIGNFARNEVQCVSLVENGAAKQLVELLKQENAEPTLLHAAFSALRNLAIPEKNKTIMLELGMVDAVLPHISVDFSAVQFSLLGTLRIMLINQPAACTELGSNPVFMARLAEWCAEEEHAGVKGEATRLAANLVKTSNSKEVCKNVVSSGCLKHIIKNVESSFVIMQCEALIAITLIIKALPEGSICEELQTQELIPAIAVQLEDEETQDEVLINCITCAVELAQKSESSLGWLSHGLKTPVEKLFKHKNQHVSVSAKALHAKLKGGSN